MDTPTFLHYTASQPDYRGQIVHIEHLIPRRAKFAQPERPLAAELEDCLSNNGLLPLYSHQAKALDCARLGEQVMIATSSASGKSLCYNLPVMEALLNEPSSCALYLFPTKALAQDQLRSLSQLCGPLLPGCEQLATYDGDTPPAERPGIRKRARIILTNPDMLHAGILPNHRAWSRLLRRLKYIVVDEAHSYRGVFGSHVACVLRRLRRLCRIYGSNPSFICCSATINNPGEHARRLSGLPFTVVDSDGAPRGSKDFAFWNPPYIDQAKSIRHSANSEAACLFSQLVGDDIRTIAFTRTRRLTELVANYSRQRLAEQSPELARRIKAYRAGYLPEQRRQIEQDLFSGRLIGVVATNAMELGIDIGDLEATVLTGYPGTVASTWQQAGRSGRGEGNSLSILVALDNPLDQYFMHHPDDFFRKSFENALVNPENPYILKAHLLCAAWESPLSDADEAFFGSSLSQERREMEEQGLLRERRHRWYLSPSVAYPAQEVNIRATSGENIALIDSSTNSLLETVDSSVALFQVHPGAIYLHQGEPYLVTELDLVGHTATVKPTSVNYYTVSKDITELRILKESSRKKYGPVEICLGHVEVTTTVVGFKKKAQFTEEIIGEEPLDLPQQRFPTVALWSDVPAKIINSVNKAQLDLAGGLHAAEHAAIAILPLFAMCDRNDIGGVSTPLHPDTGKAQIFIYDACPGGVGISEKGFDLVTELWQSTLRVIAECPCHQGCPSCVQSPKCGNNNEPLDKKAAQMILAGLLAGVTSNGKQSIISAGLEKR
jgi:DEAD/DEAH box helicase domain-containing protein